jgi:hypothetical protein
MTIPTNPTLPLFRPLVQELLAETGARLLLVNNTQAASLLAPGSDVQLVSPAELLAGSWPQRADLAILVLLPEEREQATALIAATRDLYAKRLLLFVPPEAFEWKSETLIALGLSLLANYELEGEAWQAWGFDIRSYKSVPDWLNPRFWANPENWGKYRW